MILQGEVMGSQPGCLLRSVIAREMRTDETASPRHFRFLFSILSLSTQHGWTPLHLAARYGDVEGAKALHEKGADIEAKDDVRTDPSPSHRHHTSMLPPVPLLHLGPPQQRPAARALDAFAHLLLQLMAITSSLHSAGRPRCSMRSNTERMRWPRCCLRWARPQGRQTEHYWCVSRAPPIF